MTISSASKSRLRASSLFRLLLLLAGSVAFLQSVECGLSSDAFTEYQVKALFLLNFTKYVDWPTNAFAGAETPITIGVVGENKIGAELEKIIPGRSANGRPIALKVIDNSSDLAQCQILFIGNSETKRQREILSSLRKAPVLTVGETGQFLDEGGMINFVLKEGKVRLEINLASARKANLQISSKLLSVADTVKER